MADNNDSFYDNEENPNSSEFNRVEQDTGTVDHPESPQTQSSENPDASEFIQGDTSDSFYETSARNEPAAVGTTDSFNDVDNQGAQGIPGEMGVQGLTGNQGDTGNGITSVTRVGDVLNILFTNGSTTQIALSDGSDGRGVQSITEDGNIVTVTLDDGVEFTFAVNDGTDGRGVTSITRNSSNGLVTILYTDNTSQTFTIEDGTDGTNGTNGDDGTNGTNGTNGSNGTDGINGTNGAAGKEVTSIVRNSSNEIVTFSYNDGTNYQVLVKDGPQGPTGPQGIPGTDGGGVATFTWADYRYSSLYESHTDTTVDTTRTITLKLQYGGVEMFIYRQVIVTDGALTSDIIYQNEGLTTVLATKGE